MQTSLNAMCFGAAVLALICAFLYVYQHYTDKVNELESELDAWVGKFFRLANTDEEFYYNLFLARQEANRNDMTKVKIGATMKSVFTRLGDPSRIQVKIIRVEGVPVKRTTLWYDKNQFVFEGKKLTALDVRAIQLLQHD